MGEFIKMKTKNILITGGCGFIGSDEFVKTAIGLGFKLKYFTEENNLSVRVDDNPVLMRIVLEK